jgi:riboflavin transporter FmnP
MNNTNRVDAKRVAMLGMLAAIAYAVTFVTHFIIPPFFNFLSYDPKDIVIAIGGFIFGPLSGLVVAAVVSLIEMITISTTGPIGCIMNILSSCCFAVVAAFIYKKKHTLQGAIIGLVVGALATTAFMLLWNYLITPIYMGMPRQAVADMLVPVFLPFNLTKYALNAAITMLIYKPVVTALRKAHLIAPSSSGSSPSGGGNRSMVTVVVSVVVLIVCIVAFLAMQGVFS